MSSQLLMLQLFERDAEAKLIHAPTSSQTTQMPPETAAETSRNLMPPYAYLTARHHPIKSTARPQMVRMGLWGTCSQIQA